MVAVLVMVVVGLSPAASANLIFKDENTPSKLLAIAQHKGHQIDQLLVCASPYMHVNDVYVIKDRIQGKSYSVTVLQSITYGDVRIAWNNQLPSTYSGVALYLHGTNNFFQQHANDAAISGECGSSMGYPGSNYRVRVDFGGIDVSVTSSSSRSYTLTLSAQVGSNFQLSLTNVGAGINTQFGVSGSQTITEGYTITWQGRSKIFEQRYSSTLTPEMHPLTTE